MCVFSIVMQDSFDKLETFFEQILRVSEKEKIPFMLVGNKLDLEEQREVDPLRGQELAAKYDCPYLETSAKTNTNVEDTFHTLVRSVISVKGEVAETGDGKPGAKKGKCVLS